MHLPEIFNHKNDTDKQKFKQIALNPAITVFDEIDRQLLDLMLCRHPALSSEQVQAQGLVEEFLQQNAQTNEEYGNWVYYPWKKLVVHVLPEREFVEVRTNRNKYKITPEEQEKLGQKVVGIAGLSVGRTIATTMALERVAGEIRLADFDEIELSNLNRIKAPLTEIGLNKAIATAREIAEIDPYIKVVCYKNGLSEENMNSFFTSERKMDLFIEECDDIKIKVVARLKCKELQIPVIMETNDNCIIDIERFDLEPERPIFHGKLSEEDIELCKVAKTLQQKMVILTKIIDPTTISDGLKRSLPEIGKSIRSWPQVASDVISGGGILVQLSTRILIGKDTKSGSFISESSVLSQLC